MENMEVILSPKEIHISTQPSFSLRFTYKKMTITTNHELQKFENRECYQIKNSIASIKDEVKFTLSKQFELSNTKIVIVVIGIKGRQVCCLGDISLDLAYLRQKKIKEKDKELFKARVDKCKDPKAFLVFDISFFQKPIDINELKKNKKQQIPELGILKTDYYYKQELYISRRQKQDKPTAYQISRKNYKKTQITRNDNTNSLSKQKKYPTTISKEKNNFNNIDSSKNHLNTVTTQKYNNPKTLSKEKGTSKDSLKENSSQGSYKKRFNYDVQRLEKSRQKSHSKQIGSNYLTVYQKEHKFKDKSPSPRMKTPEPITLQTLKSKQTHRRTQSKVQPLNFSQIHNRNNISQSQQNYIIDADTFRANHEENTTLEHLTNPPFQKLPQQHLHHSNVSASDIHNSNVSANSLESIKNEKDNKYKFITQKLEMIESKIRKEKEKYTNTHDDDQPLGHSKSEIQELQSYQIGNSQIQQAPSPITQKTYNEKLKQVSPTQQKTEIIDSRITDNRHSPSQSTCPKNQKPPSPIHEVDQTPQVNRNYPEDIKMSEFTINSRINKIAGLEQQHFTQMQSPMGQSLKQTFSMSKNFQNVSGSLQGSRQGISISQQSRVGSREKREISPPLQKKSSIGRNYIETQVKMLQLEIQQKDMKYERLEKKHMKKQEECSKLWSQNEEYEKKLTALSGQLIQTKSRLLQIQKQNQQVETLQQTIKDREKQIKQKKSQIQNLTLQIQKLKESQISAFTKSTKPRTNNQEVQTQVFQEQQRAKLKEQNVDLQKNEQVVRNYLTQIQKQNNLIQSLNSQLETYEHEISSLRQRNQQLFTLKSKNQELFSINQTHLNRISFLQNQLRSLQQKVQNPKQYSSKEINQPGSPYLQNSKSNPQSQKSLSQKLISPESNSANNTERQFPETPRTQQLLQKTIQKQSILQQSLKSLQTQNKLLTQNLKTATDNLKSVQAQKKNLQDKLFQVQEQKKQLQLSLNQQQKKYQLDLNKTKQLEKNNNKSLQNQIQSLNQKLQKKQKTIQKLSSINESLNTKIFNLEQQNNTKFNELNQQTDSLVLKNAENQQLINELKQKILSKDKQMNILKQLLRDRQDQDQKQKQKTIMKRQPSSQSQKSEKHTPHRLSDNFRNSKSDRLINIKVTEQGKENFYENYLNEKAKSTNLQAQLRYAENDIRNLKMKIDLLVHQKKDLEQEIDMIAYNNDRDLAKKGLQHKVTMENNSISQSVKLQNKALKQEIKLLQSQVKDLNLLLDSAIQRTADFESSQISALLSNPTVEKSIINEKYVALTRRLEAYESELRTKKNKMAQIVNAIWRGGNASLIDEIDRIMGADE